MVVEVEALHVYAVETEVVKPGDSVVDIVLSGVKKQSLTLEDYDVLAVSSKAVATAENRIVRLSEVSASPKALMLAEKHGLEPEFVELVLREADKIYGGVEKALLTLKNHGVTVNAGVDHKNVPEGTVILWPESPQRSAEEMRRLLQKKTGRRVGVLIVDSEVAPLKLGTRGSALAVSGFKPVKDVRGEKDIYLKPLLITQHAVADDLASAAHIVMGEAGEKTPAALLRGAPVEFVEKKFSGREMYMPVKRCVYSSLGL